MTTSAEYIPQIQTLLDNIAKHEGETLIAAVKCGFVLIGAKAALKAENKTGDETFGALWKVWLASNFGVAVNTADLYIRLYQHRDKFPNAKTITDARKKLPKERATPKPPKAEAKGGVMREDDIDEVEEDEEEAEEREYDPGQALAEAIPHITPETLHDEVVGLWDQSKRDEVTSLFLHDYDREALMRKFGVQPVTAVTNQPAVATKAAAETFEKRV